MAELARRLPAARGEAYGVSLSSPARCSPGWPPGLKSKEAEERREEGGNETMAAIRPNNDTGGPSGAQRGARCWHRPRQPPAGGVRTCFPEAGDEHEKTASPLPAQTGCLGCWGVERRCEQPRKEPGSATKARAQRAAGGISRPCLSFWEVASKTPRAPSHLWVRPCLPVCPLVLLQRDSSRCLPQVFWRGRGRKATHSHLHRHRAGEGWDRRGCRPLLRGGKTGAGRAAAPPA